MSEDWRLVVCIADVFWNVHVVVLFRLPDAVREQLGAKADAVAKSLAVVNSATNANLMSQSSERPSTTERTTVPENRQRRTLCRPVFSADEQPLDVLRVVEPQTMQVVDFDAHIVRLGRY